MREVVANPRFSNSDPRGVAPSLAEGGERSGEGAALRDAIAML